MVLDHFAALEADFCRFYGIDLPAAIWSDQPPMSGRRLQTLIAGLPPESKLGRDVDPRPLGWGHNESLLAAVAELVDQGNRLLHHAFFKSPHPQPIKIPRPELLKHVRPQMATAQEMRRFFGGAVQYSPKGEA